jgi:RecA/RadA recombinase
MEMLSTGSTLLNLAVSGNPFGGLLPGHYYYLVGDSESGKTFLSMTCAAEAAINPTFKQYRVIYDNIEDGMLMDLDTLFSEEVADRIEPPATHKGEPVFSDTVESLYYHIDDAVKGGRPFIYILDSMDALDSEAAEKKFDKQKAAYRRREARRRGDEVEGKADEEQVAGSYGTDKAKKNSEYVRKAIRGLRQTNSILLIISQTRDNIGGYGRTRAGGRALRFYATWEVWSSVAEEIHRTVNNKRRKIGVRVELQVRKNRLNGKKHTVQVDIYPTVGIDDIGSCVDYLVSEGWWGTVKQKIKAPELDIVATRDKLIRLVERRGLEHRLRELCGTCWDEIEQACSVTRKNRYAGTQEGEPQ